MSEPTPTYATWGAMEDESIPIPPDNVPMEWHEHFKEYLQYERDRAIAKVRACDRILYGRPDKTIPERTR